MTHTNPFAKDPQNPYAKLSHAELSSYRNTLAYCVEHPETYADGTRLDESRARLAEATEEMERRGDVERAVELWERLCSVPFVRGETQGYYTHSTRHMSPEGERHYPSGVCRMPDTAEIEALVLSDGEEAAYPPHDVDDSTHLDSNPWSGGDRLYPITLTLISCGDYHGSDVDAANNRTLNDTPGVTVSEPNTGGMGSVFNVSTTVVGEMSSFENSQTTADWEREPAQRRADALMWLENLVKQMEGLTDYSLLDDETHSELISKLAEEAWSDHLESKTFDALRDLASSHLPDDQDADEWIDGVRAYEENEAQVHSAYFGYKENEWNAESATSVVNGRHEDAVKHVARTVFRWSV